MIYSIFLKENDSKLPSKLFLKVIMVLALLPMFLIGLGGTASLALVVLLMQIGN